MTTALEPIDVDESILEHRADQLADAIEAGYVDPDLTDPEAPYGRRRDGRPYTMSPEKRAEVGARLAAARRAASSGGGARRRTKAPAAPRKTAGTGTGGAAAKASTPDYRPALSGMLVQLPSFALSMLGRVDPAFHADAAAVVVHGPALVDAVAETALADERLAALLDRITKVGPYGLVVTAALPLVLQLLANHQVIPPNRELGVLPAAELLDGLPPAPAAAAA